jgi:hypothetical protein
VLSTSVAETVALATIPEGNISKINAVDGTPLPHPAAASLPGNRGIFARTLVASYWSSRAKRFAEQRVEILSTTRTHFHLGSPKGPHRASLR